MSKLRILVFTVLILFVGAAFYEAEALSSIQIKRIQEAIAKIQNPARGMQRQGYKEIKYIGIDSAPYLSETLKDRAMNFDSRTIICDILGEFKYKEAVPDLIYTLKNESDTVRTAACKALGQIADPSATDALLSMLGDAQPNVRAEALTALINFNDPRIAGEGAKLLSDKDERVRTAAITLLDSKLDPQTVEAVRSALKYDGSPNVRMIAARALGGLKDAGAVDLLTEAIIEDKAQGVREESAGALGKIGDKKAIPVLIEALKDDYKDVQLKAAASLKELTGEDFGRDYNKWLEWSKK